MGRAPSFFPTEDCGASNGAGGSIFLSAAGLWCRQWGRRQHFPHWVRRLNARRQHFSVCGRIVAQAMGQAAAFSRLRKDCGECLWSWLESSCNHRPQEATPDNTLGRGNVANQTILSNLPHQPTLQSTVKGPGVAGELQEQQRV